MKHIARNYGGGTAWKWIRILGFLCIAGIVRAQPLTEELFGLRQSTTGWRCERINLSTGGVVSSTLLPVGSQSIGPIGLTHNSSRLIALDALIWNDRVFTLHPTGTTYSVGSLTGTNWVQISMEVHPLTGVVYFTQTDQLFTLDLATGTLTPGPIFTGFSAPGDYIMAFAMDATGACIGIGTGHSAGHNYVYQIDLTTGYCTQLGQLIVGAGWFYDLAFSASSGLWGSWHDVAVASRQGLYRIDLTNFTATQLQVMTHPYFGLAFGPGTVITSYCTAKTNSQGCVPQITVDGIASPSANAGFSVSAVQVFNQKVGRLLLGFSGSAATPFAGGTLCLAPPMVGTMPISSGGSPIPAVDCSGAWVVDFNAVQHSWPLMPAGTTFQCQWLGRDPGFAPPNNLSLSAAIEFTLLP